MNPHDYSYAFDELATHHVTSALQTIPPRWGRMTPLSRAVVVEAAFFLKKKGLIDKTCEKQNQQGRSIGLIGGSRWGSLATDLAFIKTMEENPAFASPAIFGYTLANIPLAEAASQFGLTGPVYAIIEAKNPLNEAQKEARRLLRHTPGLDMMLACEFDAHYCNETNEQLSVTFTLVGKHD